MTARTFGRKGIVAGASVGPAPRAAFGMRNPDHFEPIEIDETALRRAAFVAEERARAAHEANAEALPPEPILHPGKSLRNAYALWGLLGLVGAHRFYLARPITGGLMAAIFAGSVGLVFAEYYPAFAGAFLVGIWVAIDGLMIKRMHSIATTGKA